MEWPDLTRSERSMLIGIGGVSVAALAIAILTTSRMRKGIPLRIEVDDATRNLVTSATADWTQAMDKLTTIGVPVKVSLFKGV